MPSSWFGVTNLLPLARFLGLNYHGNERLQTIAEMLLRPALCTPGGYAFGAFHWDGKWKTEEIWEENIGLSETEESKTYRAAKRRKNEWNRKGVAAWCSNHENHQLMSEMSPQKTEDLRNLAFKSVHFGV